MEYRSEERVRTTCMRSFAENEQCLEEESISIAKHFSCVYTGFEGDDEVFIDVEDIKEAKTTMSKSGPSGRERRASDVIDSMGDENFDITPAPPRRFTAPNLTSSHVEEFLLPSFSVVTPLSPTTPHSDLGYSSSSAINSPMEPKTFRFNCNPPVTDTLASALLRDSVDAIVNQPSVPTEPPVPASRELIAVAPASRESLVYNMNHLHRGIGLILNHKQFKEGNNLPQRDGTDVDVARLLEVYDKLGLEPRIFHDAAYEEIMKILYGISKEDHSDRDCLVVTILTHGFQSNFLWAYDIPYSINDLWNFFFPEHCISLAGKPKIFFIQACRGKLVDQGVSFVSRKFSETDSGFESYTIPRMADYFTAHSTPEGYFAWRNPEFGTWFIKALAEVFLEEFETSDLTTMMLRVSHKVAVEYQSVNELLPWRDGMKQVPSTMSTLIRQVYFKKK